MRTIILFLALVLNGTMGAFHIDSLVGIPGEMKHLTPVHNDRGEAILLWCELDADQNEKIAVMTREVDQTWSAPVFLTSSEHGLSKEKCYVDAEGNFYACWIVKSTEYGKPGTVWFAKKGKGKSWNTFPIMTPEERIVVIDSFFDRQGNIFTYGKKEDSEKQYPALFNYIHSSGKKQLYLHSDTSGYSYELAFVANQKMQQFVVWSKSEYEIDEKGHCSRIQKLEGVMLNQDLQPSSPETLYAAKDDSGYYRTIMASMNQNKQIAVVWERWESSDDETQLQVVTSSQNGWSEVTTLARSKEYPGNLSISIDNNGNCVATWLMDRVIYAAYKEIDQPWSSPVVLSDPAKKAYDFKVVVDKAGNILVAWNSFSENREVLYVSHKFLGQPWSSPIAVSNEKRSIVGYTALTDTKGHFFLGWVEKQRLNFPLYGATLSTETGKWSTAMISPPGKDCFSFALHFNEKGQGLLAWTEMNWKEKRVQLQMTELKLD
jgi:hypothetical protein